MKSLFIDTSSSRRIVAIASDNELIYILNEDNGLDLSSNMLPLISEAFEKSQIKIEDIDKIFVVIGPGSFTGIRVGVTIAKTIAWALEKDIIPISELELMASGNDGIVIPLIDARRGFVYGGIYNNNTNIFNDKHILLSDIINESIKIHFVEYEFLYALKVIYRFKFL